MVKMMLDLNEEQNKKVELLKPIFRCKTKAELVLKLLDLVNITEPDTQNIISGLKVNE